MRATYRLVLGALLGVLPLASAAGGGSVVRELRFVFKAGEYERVARLAELSARDLRFASKAENIGGLLNLAEMEGRIPDIEKLPLSRRFASAGDGDSMMLICLQRVKCQPGEFLDIVQTSSLHAEVVKRNPELGLIQAHHAVGTLTENLMTRYFEHSGWTRIEGQVGRQGFDGLFVKIEDGVIKDVLISESKYNKSALQSTSCGVQMSRDWTRCKMVELKDRFPEEKRYQEIDDKFIEAGDYRAVLWNLRVEDDALNIGISKVVSKGRDVITEDPVGTDIDVLSAPVTNNIRLKAPRNDFERQVLGWYEHELDVIAERSIK